MRIITLVLSLVSGFLFSGFFLPSLHAATNYESPALQTVAGCRCPEGSKMVCEKGYGDVNGTNGAWGDCKCLDASKQEVPFLPSLRLQFRWMPSNYVFYQIPPAQSKNARLPADRTGSQFINADDFLRVVDESFKQWQPACCGSQQPAIRVIRADTPSDDDGIAHTSLKTNPQTTNVDADTIKTIRNKVWVAYSDDCQQQDGKIICQKVELPPGALAVTPVTFYPGPDSFSGSEQDKIKKFISRRIIRARTIFNGKDYAWRIDAEKKGCDKSLTVTASNGKQQPVCYDFPSVATHEFGHFLGFQHSACRASIMFGEADVTTVKHTIENGDRDSVCGLSECSNSGYPSGRCAGEYSYVRQKDSAKLNWSTLSADCSKKPDAAQNDTYVRANCASRFELCRQDADCRQLDGQPGSVKCSNQSSFYWPAGWSKSGLASIPKDAVDNVGHCNLTCSADEDCPQGERCFTRPDGAESFCVLENTLAANQCKGRSAPSDNTDLKDLCKICETNDDCLGGLCLVTSADSQTGFCSAYCPDSNYAPCTQNAGSCKKIGSNSDAYLACIPNDSSCIDPDKQKKQYRQLNESCKDDVPCVAGTVCYPLTADSVCLESCDPYSSASGTETGKCSTDGFECVYDQGIQSGVCFKAVMKEGESCVYPDTSLCGTDFKKLCAYENNDVMQSRCYVRCGDTYGNTCASGQTCTGGVCRPLSASQSCIEQLGGTCKNNEDCSSSLCSTHSNFKLCSKRCSLTTKLGCPSGFDCVSSGTADDKNGICWPTSNQVVAHACDQGGCKCQGGASGALEASMMALFLLFRKIVSKLRK